MKEQKGKFILFSIDEFRKWLDAANVQRAIRLIQVHHTFQPDYSSFKGNNHFDLLESIENYHVKVKGWKEIAQNFTTFPDGTVALCRSLDTDPAGIQGANHCGICIENLGDFDSGKDAMKDAHRDAIIKLYAILCHRFKLAPSIDTIVYHHWYDLETHVRTNGTGTTKSCPGSAFFGGNNVADASNHFIPLVKQAMAGM